MVNEIRKRKTTANYLKVGEKFVLMGVGFKDLTESPSAQTTSKRYVNESSTTKRVSSYDWSTPFNTDQIREQEAIDFICDIGELQKTGADAETEYLIVDLDKPGTTEKTFRARKFNIAIEVASFDDEDGELAATGNLLGQGDPIVGTFNTTTNTFTEGFSAKAKSVGRKGDN
ncbi:hypothetical protein GNF80_06580 [Clostridium perfringens]|nr:hypothetical protein [Clostridium perfringens]